LNRWIPIVLFLVSLAQLAPANLCLCSILPCIKNASSSVSNASSHQGELFCAEEESCPCHEEKDVPPCRSEKNQSSHSCPFDQTTVVSDYAGPKSSLKTRQATTFNFMNSIPSLKFYRYKKIPILFRTTAYRRFLCICASNLF